MIKFYILNLNFRKKTNHGNFENILIYKAKQYVITKKFKKHLHILEDGASGVHVDDIEFSIQ